MFIYAIQLQRGDVLEGEFVEAVKVSDDLMTVSVLTEWGAVRVLEGHRTVRLPAYHE